MFGLLKKLSILLLSSFILNSYAKPLENLSIMPWPKDIIHHEGRFNFTPNFNIVIEGDDLNKTKNYWLERIAAQTGWNLLPQHTNPDFTIMVRIQNQIDKVPTVTMDESYQLSINASQIILTANNRFGALRGMETLLQLLQNDENGAYLPYVNISDAPRFSWRGLLIDTARHFIPMDDLKRQLQGMAAAKLNVFHWHLTDDQGWRFESTHYPKLQALASDGHYFTKTQMKELVNFAAELGIRVVPEIDVPGHASSIAIAYPELMSLPTDPIMERNWGVHKPTLDPSNPAVDKFIETLISELVEIFPDEYIHIGGDEVDGYQWNNSEKIQSFMKKESIKDVPALQAYFNRKVEKILAKYHRKMVGWDEVFHPDLPRSTVIQSWQGQDALGSIASEQYQGILSTGFYIDQPQSAAYHYRNEIIPKLLTVDQTVKNDEKAESWSFEMPRLKGSAVTGTFTLIRSNTNLLRGFIDFTNRSRREIQNIKWKNNQVRFSVDTWMGETTPVITLDNDNNVVSGYFLVGNVRYPITAKKLTEIPKGKLPVIPESKNQSYIIGGEAALWAENIIPESMDIKIWPRTFVIAERLWSPEQITDEKNMYQRLQNLDTWSTVSVGLMPYAQSMRLMMRLAKSTNIEPLQIFAEAVEPAQYYTRHHSKFKAGNYHQQEPLYRFADALLPENQIVNNLKILVEKVTENNNQQQAKDEIAARFKRWINNHNALMKIVESNYMMKDLIPVVRDIKSLAQMGLNLLDILQTKKVLTAKEYKDYKNTLNQMAKMRDEIVISAVYPIENLLDSIYLAQK